MRSSIRPGVTRAASLEELIDVATLLSSQPEPKGRRVAVLTNAGGLGILAADACDAAGLELPRSARRRPLACANCCRRRPASRTRSTCSARPPPRATGKRFRSCSRTRRWTRCSCSSSLPSAQQPTRSRSPSTRGACAGVREAGARRRHERRGRPGGAARGSAVAGVRLPRVGGARARARGRARRVASAAARGRPALEGIDRAAAARVVERALARSEDAWLDPAETRELLGLTACRSCPSGLPWTPRRRRGGARARLPGRCQVRRSGRSQDGDRWRRAGPEDEAAVRAAAERIGSRRRAADAARRYRAPGGLLQDPVFGPLVAFGPGGVFAELIGEAAPARAADRHRRRGARRRPERRVGSCAASAGAACRPGCARRPRPAARRARGDLPAVAELDLNPVLGFPDHAVAVDARIRIRRPQSSDAKRAGSRSSSPQAESGAMPMPPRSSRSCVVSNGSRWRTR